ncbi:MAG: hypothetical protein MJ117_00125 [Lachnospiraceae bacterium]|nr:hypothetical protein [Lachnospiraceae bacterium]
MIEIAFEPHDTMGFVQKLVTAEQEVKLSGIYKQIAGRETELQDAFDLNELEEIAEYIQTYVKHRRQEQQ